MNKIKLKKHFKYLYTLKFVKLLSYISARSLSLKLNQNHSYKYMYYYGFQILYGAINKFLLLITAGLLFHALPQILIATLAFMSLRVYIGGLHFNNYTKCAYMSLLCLVSIGVLSKYIPYNNIIDLCVFIYLLVIAVMYAPVEHKNRPLTDKKKLRFKYISITLIIVLFMVQILINDNNINNCIMYGVLLSGIIALPIFKNVT